MSIHWLTVAEAALGAFVGFTAGAIVERLWLKRRIDRYIKTTLKNQKQSLG